ncbi:MULTISPECIES: hypothetical protein [Mesorhizobium]|uniref:Uncharacterized protein n=1 Tax=Mesorhizobium ciceri TaxID=39645 RepID=A0AB38TK26_9HYPH|nr:MULTISPECIES: hypothetical protein [Mesorhizobium]MDF3212580.1 hypothetical protein [Mesorhizobium ciceri]UTU54995.1 hypothetical protein LRP29_15995 [Mesorhizobium ciceri]
MEGIGGLLQPQRKMRRRSVRQDFGWNQMRMGIMPALMPQLHDRRPVGFLGWANFEHFSPPTGN